MGLLDLDSLLSAVYADSMRSAAIHRFRFHRTWTLQQLSTRITDNVLVATLPLYTPVMISYWIYSDLRIDSEEGWEKLPPFASSPPVATPLTETARTRTALHGLQAVAAKF